MQRVMKHRLCSKLLYSCNQTYSKSNKCGWDLETTDIYYGKLIHFCDQMVKELDRIAMDCLEKLRSQHPDHPALTSPIIPPSTPLKESRWAQDKCYQLFKCINHVLFSQVCTELCFVNWSKGCRIYFYRVYTCLKFWNHPKISNFF